MNEHTKSPCFELCFGNKLRSEWKKCKNIAPHALLICLKSRSKCLTRVKRAVHLSLVPGFRVEWRKLWLWLELSESNINYDELLFRDHRQSNAWNDEDRKGYHRGAINYLRTIFRSLIVNFNWRTSRVTKKLLRLHLLLGSRLVIFRLHQSSVILSPANFVATFVLSSERHFVPRGVSM